MPFVHDTSILMSAAFADEDDRLARQILLRLDSDWAVVPALFWFEMRDALVTGERRGRITEAQTAAFLEVMRSLTIKIDRRPAEMRILDLARHHRLTVYDAAYLELAWRRNWALATNDAALVRAAGLEKVSLWPA
jgi:predicted nucleic acid-binding protein